MRYIVVVVSICFVVSIASMIYAEEQIDHYCKTDCIARGNTPGNCNSICALTDSSGRPIKNTECVSSCLKKGWTRYNCYYECESGQGNTQKPVPVN
ncbi:MAG: hypothetical protein A4E65_00244 [Syntrophorhabdus sp. PtaU1.Bin153]|nr:MAG: hypothetical protein A4E65_00244 [Syntrophorhabdus sp. PtaU1.Bin153]